MSIRFKFVAALLATLIVGAVIGSLLAGRMYEQRMRKLSHLRTTEGFVARMEEVIGEQTAAQRARTRPVLQHTAEEIRRQYQESREERKVIFDSMHARLTPLLTAEQKARVDEHSARVRRRHQARKDSTHRGDN